MFYLTITKWPCSVYPHISELQDPKFTIIPLEHGHKSPGSPFMVKAIECGKSVPIRRSSSNKAFKFPLYQEPACSTELNKKKTLT